MLQAEGVLSIDDEIVKNKLYLMTGAYAADLLNAIGPHSTRHKLYKVNIITISDLAQSVNRTTPCI